MKMSGTTAVLSPCWRDATFQPEGSPSAGRRSACRCVGGVLSAKLGVRWPRGENKPDATVTRKEREDGGSGLIPRGGRWPSPGEGGLGPVGWMGTGPWDGKARKGLGAGLWREWTAPQSSSAAVSGLDRPWEGGRPLRDPGTHPPAQKARTPVVAVGGDSGDRVETWLKVGVRGMA